MMKTANIISLSLAAFISLASLAYSLPLDMAERELSKTDDSDIVAISASDDEPAPPGPVPVPADIPVPSVPVSDVASSPVPAISSSKPVVDEEEGDEEGATEKEESDEDSSSESEESEESDESSEESEESEEETAAESDENSPEISPAADVPNASSPVPNPVTPESEEDKAESDSDSDSESEESDEDAAVKILETSETVANVVAFSNGNDIDSDIGNGIDTDGVDKDEDDREPGSDGEFIDGNAKKQKVVSVAVPVEAIDTPEYYDVVGSSSEDAAEDYYILKKDAKKPEEVFTGINFEQTIFPDKN